MGGGGGDSFRDSDGGGGGGGDRGRGRGRGSDGSGGSIETGGPSYVDFVLFDLRLSLLGLRNLADLGGGVGA